MYYYECEAWEIEPEYGGMQLVQEEDPSICPVFSIEIFANLVSHQPTITQQLFLPQAHHFTSWWSPISIKLSQMQVPFTLHAAVTQKIIECARSAACETRNKNRNEIPIFVTLCSVAPTTLSESDEDYELASAFEESFENASVLIRMRGARKDAIESLEKVQVEGNNLTVQLQCVICLEQISDGLKACRMPCSHVYHQHCIVTWLENSNLCPLCRFQMPTT